MKGTKKYHSETELFNQHLPMVKRIACNYRGLDVDNLIGEGSLALLKAIRKFDPSYKVKFSTFAFTCISNAIKKEVSKEIKSGLEELEPPYVYPEDNISEYFPKMSKIQNKILKLKLKGYTIAEIADKLEKTESMICTEISNCYELIRKANE